MPYCFVSITLVTVINFVCIMPDVGGDRWLVNWWDLFACFGRFERLGIGSCSRMSFFSLQKVKTSFVFLLWIETRKIIQDGPSNVAGFIDWVGCK